MSYLVFIVAVGLFALLGAGGPLHRDGWFQAISRRVEAVELDLWPSLALRVGAPFGLLAPCRFNRLGQPALNILSLNNTNFSQLSVGNHFSRLTDHRITRIIVS